MSAIVLPSCRRSVRRWALSAVPEKDRISGTAGSGETTAAFIRLRVHSSHPVHQQQQDSDRDDDEHRDWEEQPGAVVVPPSQHEKRCYHAYRKPTRTEAKASDNDNQNSQTN